VITVEVVDARGARLRRVAVRLPAGSRVDDALAASGLWRADHIGVARFGQRVEGDALLAEGDRLELLRALQADPKQARRRRAAMQGAAARPPR
jgi:putative ubiquitin-RnfH superfamily antitoxin RatB of RatAB toxin-antitoxin module